MSNDTTATSKPSMQEQQWADDKGRNYHAERPFERHGNTYRRLHVELPDQRGSFRVYQVWKPEQRHYGTSAWKNAAGALDEESGGTVYLREACPECGNTADPDSGIDFGAEREQTSHFGPGGEGYVCSKCGAFISNSWMSTHFPGTPKEKE